MKLCPSMILVKGQNALEGKTFLLNCRNNYVYFLEPRESAALEELLSLEPDKALSHYAYRFFLEMGFFDADGLHEI